MAKNGVIQNKQQQNAVKKAENEQLTMRGYVKKMSGAIAQALPSVMTPERFTRMVFTALASNPQLNDCTPDSFLGAMMTAAQLGVEPNTALGQAYIIPYRNKGVLEAQFQLGYKGLIDLAYRSGEVSIIHGNGMGILRAGIQDCLRRHPCVSSFRLGRYGEGETGVTIVSIK